MKHLAAILLTAIVLFSTTACDFLTNLSQETKNEFSINGSESLESKANTESDQAYTDNTENSESDSNVADFSSYEAIIETYKAIVNCFPEYSVEQYKKNECIYTLEFSNEESRVIYERIFFSAFYHYKDDYAVEYLDDGRNYFGYALYDLNKNGSDELILLNDHYDIIAIFTNFDGTPKLIIDNEHYCRIDSEGKIYTQNRVYEENDYYPGLSYYYNIKVHTLTESDELVVTEEYQAMNPGGNYSFFIDVTNGQSVEISRTEFIERAHGCLYNTEVTSVTQSSLNLDFVRLFSPLNPHIPEIYSWMWYESKYIDDTFVIISNTTETTVGIAFYSNPAPWTYIAGVTATRSGEKAYFESETLSGRLEFGLDCIWIVITESKSNVFPCGAYIYQYYETLK